MQEEVTQKTIAFAMRAERLTADALKSAISDRSALQSADNAEKFITTRQIESFESLAKFTADSEQKYQQLETVHLSKGQKINRLKELSKMYGKREGERNIKGFFIVNENDFLYN